MYTLHWGQRVSAGHTHNHKSTPPTHTSWSIAFKFPIAFLKKADDPSAISQPLENHSHTHTYTLLAPLTAGQDWLTVTLKDLKDLVGGVYRVTNSFIFRSFSSKSRSVDFYCSFWFMIALAFIENVKSQSKQGFNTSNGHCHTIL